MPRVRKKREHYWLPTRVYPGRYYYEYHPAEGGCIMLCPINSDRTTVLLSHERALKKLPLHTTVRELFELYSKSARFLQTAPKTQKSYFEYWRAVEGYFGDMDCRSVLPLHIREYMDDRGRMVSANRERALLSNVFGYALEYGKVSSNPCTGVRLFKEKGRQKMYIEDDEYYAFLKDSSQIIQVFMELSYLLGARGQDIRIIKISDLREDGIYIVQQKTGKKQLKRWNPRLRDVVELAMKIRKSRVDPLRDCSDFLIVTTHGSAYSDHGLISIWKRNREKVLKKRMAKANGKKVEDITWTFHDIKAKSISDYAGDKQVFSGHKTRSQMERYNRSPDVMDALGHEQRPLLELIKKPVSSDDSFD